MSRKLVALLAFSLLAAPLVAAAGAATPPPAGAVSAVAACANPHLPAEILAGDGPLGGVTPLPVIDATAGEVKLRLAVANDETNRELGLMCVTRLRPHRGMIFVFPQSGDQEFWMKDTLIPLDMLWVAADGTVTTVASEVPASTLQTPDDKVARRRGTGRYVIELPAGEAAADGIKAQTRIALPPLATAR
jgi:hypothetical protein